MKRHYKSKKKRKKRISNTKRKYIRYRMLLWGGILLLFILVLVLGVYTYFSEDNQRSSVDVDASMPEISVQLLDINEYSRPGIESDPITGIVVHYTANPGSSAQEIGRAHV